jgi:uncharacterized membrane protein
MRLFDLGTFGGPSSGIGSGLAVANDQGDVVGGALTSTPNPDLLNPNPFFGPAEFTQHAFRWRNGNLRDLGTLPGGHNSAAGPVNESGTIVGLPENGVIDPLTGLSTGFAVLRSHGRIHNLGALGGNQVSRLQSTIVARSLSLVLRRMTSPIPSACMVPVGHSPDGRQIAFP